MHRPRSRFVQGTDSSESDELKRAASAVFGFFLLLTGYYVLRPVREEMAVQTGADQLPWLFTGTFIFALLLVPSFGWVATRTSPGRLLQVTYGFLVLCLGGFCLAFSSGVTQTSAAIFFNWSSVFNLFVISVFWSAASESFTQVQARRFYGPIAAGGTVGAMVGPSLTAVLSRHLSTSQLLMVAATLIAAAAMCMRRLRPHRESELCPIGGSALSGITSTLRRSDLREIALFVVCYSAVSTTLYLEMNSLVRAEYTDPGERTSLFASFDLAVNLLALVIQLVITPLVAQRFGLRAMLALVPAFVLAGLMLAGSQPTILWLAIVQILHRAGEFSLVRPGRESIYTTVDEETRYKAKNFIDTAVYRGGDAGCSWIVARLTGAGLSAVLLFGVPAALLWFVMGCRIGKQQERRDEIKVNELIL